MQNAISNDFFNAIDVVNVKAVEQVNFFCKGQFRLSTELYRHMLEAFSKLVAKGHPFKQDELTLISKLALTACVDARRPGLEKETNFYLPIDRADLNVMMMLLKLKIEHCESNRSDQEFRLETMIDMKTALLELRTLSYADITDKEN